MCRAHQGIDVTALRELKILRELRHHNIIGLLDVCTHKRNIVLVGGERRQGGWGHRHHCFCVAPARWQSTAPVLQCCPPVRMRLPSSRGEPDRPVVPGAPARNAEVSGAESLTSGVPLMARVLTAVAPSNAVLEQNPTAAQPLTLLSLTQLPPPALLGPPRALLGPPRPGRHPPRPPGPQIFELMESDLEAVIKNSSIVLSPADVKSYMQVGRGAQGARGAGCTCRKVQGAGHVPRWPLL